MWEVKEMLKAIANMKKYNDRGIKNQMILQLPQPLHAERFARIDSVSVSQSTTAFNYLKQIGLLDNSNYLIKTHLRYKWITRHIR